MLRQWRACKNVRLSLYDGPVTGVPVGAMADVVIYTRPFCGFCARVLRAAGAARVDVAAVARVQEREAQPI